MSRANELKARFKDSENAPAAREGTTAEAACKRILGAVSTVAVKKQSLRLNVDDLTTRAKNKTVLQLEADGFTVVATKDPKVKKRWWIDIDWSDPPADIEVQADPGTVP